MRFGPLLATATATAAVDVFVQAARLGAARQGWSLPEIAPALALEFGLALLLASLLLALAARTGRRGVVLGTAIVTAGGLVLASPPLTSPDLTPPTPAATVEGGASTVVLLTLDTLRRDHVSAYDDALVPGLTPRLESLADEALRFDDAVTTAPLTLPSHTSLLTGLPPDRHGVVRNGRSVPTHLASAPRRFAGAGYATAAFVSTSVLHGSHGMARWFDVYRDELGERPGARRLPLARWVPEASPASRLVKEPGERTVQRALDWLERQGEAPAFLWVHLYDAHTPHRAPEPATTAATLPDPCSWAGHPTRFRAGPRAPAPLPGAPPLPCGADTRRRVERLAAGYAAEVAHVDALVGRLIDGLKGDGRWEDTALVVVADHGESLAEHHQVGSHEYSLYEPVARVPLIVRAPGEPPGIERQQVSTVRVAATLLQLGGMEGAETMVGPGLLTRVAVRPAVLLGPSPVGRRPGNHPALTSTGLQLAVRLPPRKTLVDADEHIERYDLVEDPLERRPQLSAPERAALRRRRRAPQHLGPPGMLPAPGWRPRPPPTGAPPREVEAAPIEGWATLDGVARSQLSRWAERPADAAEPDRAELPEDVLEALRALGYVDL